MQRTMFSGFKKCHFELQNVCKAENVFRVLDTLEEVLLSVCQFKYLCYACHLSVLATGKNCNVFCCIVLRCVALCCVALHCIVLCCVMLYHVVLGLLFYVMLCCGVICFVMLYFV